MNKELLFSSVRMIVLGIGVSALLVGCSGDSADDEAPNDDATASGGDALEGEAVVASGDEIPLPFSSKEGVSGVISFAGEAPERTVIDAEGDANCVAMHKDAPILSHRVIVSADGGIANVFVYVTNEPDMEYSVPEETLKLDQIGCMYTPHILGIQVGQKLMIHNSDDTIHNVSIVARKNKARNYGQPSGSKPRGYTFKKEELKVRFKCDIHPWMNAYVFALDHPFFAVSDESGAFNISGLPAGEYNVTAWHEKFGEKTGTVTVDDNGTGKVDFTFSS